MVSTCFDLVLTHQKIVIWLVIQPPKMPQCRLLGLGLALIFTVRTPWQFQRFQMFPNYFYVSDFFCQVGC